MIPIEYFFRNPEKTDYKLSPDGEFLAFMMPWESRLNIFVQKIGEKKALRITETFDRDIHEYHWGGNDRIVYLQDSGGDENFKLYSVGADGSDHLELTPFSEVRVEIVFVPELGSNEIVISMNKRDRRLFDAYRVNIKTGRITLAAENPGRVTEWYADHNGKVRAAVANEGINTSLLYRDNEEQKFRNLKTVNFKDTLLPVMFTFDNKSLYMLSNMGRDKTALARYDIEKNSESETIFEHPEVDVKEIIVSKKQKRLLGVSFVTDKKRYHFFDEERRKLQENLEERLPGYEVNIRSMSKDEDKLILKSLSDKSRGSYYYYDIRKDEFQKIADVSPWLDDYVLSDMKPVQYVSRDGLTIHGYLTLPPRTKPANLPVVVYPHGGPWDRNVWEFDPEAQYLASLGFAVLQVNFRGSTGYGKKFWQAGFKKWGKEMQDDITDGVKWLISEGIADPDRVAIFGISYGGYAALAGLAFTPELYACGIDFVGIANLFTLFETLPPYWEPYREMFYEMVGHPEKDAELLEDVSPVFHADKIIAPLFIAQGSNDPRVSKSESDQMAEALTERGIEVPYLIKENVGHGYINEENRIEFYTAIAEFLKKHLYKNGKACRNNH